MKPKLLSVLALNALFACALLGGCASTNCPRGGQHKTAACNPACTGVKCPGPGNCEKSKRPGCCCPKKK